MPSPRVIFLAGPPEAEHLQRSSDLSDDILPSFRRYLGHADESISKTISQSTQAANWRQVLFHGQKSHQSPAPNHGGLHESVLYCLSDKTLSPDDRNDFLQHSLAVLDNLQPFQITPHGDADEDTTFITDTSFSMTTSGRQSDGGSVLDHSVAATASRQVLRLSGPITNIKAIPSTDCLHRLRPQTMTVNLVVGVISISPSRTVTVRRGNYTMDVVEMLVGDDTKAGFSISTWLSPLESQQAPKDDLRKALSRLRTGDVALIERVALSTFRGQVFGQSLNRKATKIATTVTVLPSDLGVDTTLGTVVADKARRAQEWVDGFIAPNRKRKRELEQAQARQGKRAVTVVDNDDEFLPPDSV